MKEEGNGYVGFAVFFLLILAIVCVGTFLLYKSHNLKQPTIVLEEDEKISDSFKKEQSKDFIYFQKEEVISETLSIKYKYPVINLESKEAEETTQNLKKYIDSLHSNIQKIDTFSVCRYETYDNIKEASVLGYSITRHKECVDLLIYESTYSCDKGISEIQKLKSYTFNVLTGEQITASQLLQKFSISREQVILKVREELLQNQSTINGIETIKIDNTIANLKENETFVIYIDEYGELVMKYIVKSNLVDYNDTIVLK